MALAHATNHRFGTVAQNNRRTRIHQGCVSTDLFRRPLPRLPSGALVVANLPWAGRLRRLLGLLPSWMRRLLELLLGRQRRPLGLLL